MRGSTHWNSHHYTYTNPYNETMAGRLGKNVLHYITAALYQEPWPKIINKTFYVPLSSGVTPPPPPPLPPPVSPPRLCTTQRHVTASPRGRGVRWRAVGGGGGGHLLQQLRR
ncbi:hypothetical protein E2C01_063350 [Portunus trituberculatus]|uniref:Uncharacterized protein n=1 Tax=Portunus trituberculatus TaxID=210409 RepID=A0A5B7HHX3_PORTR|nr:hypothetical protein [Portunus trituberculatus]